MGLTLYIGVNTSFRNPVLSWWEADSDVATGDPQTPGRHPRDMLQSRYRLKPDARLLRAFGVVHHFFTGQPVTPVKATFQDGEWSITYRDDTVATVSRHPQFPEVLDQLVNYSRTLQERTGRVRRQGTVQPVPELQARLSGFYLPDLLKMLDEINAVLGEKTPLPKAYPFYAAKGLTALTMQSFDAVETADDLPALALAMVAVARATTDQTLPETRARLAYFMGYSTHADGLGSDLYDSDPFRLFLERDHRRLRNVAESSRHAPEAGYLWLVSLSDRGRTSDWYEAAHRQLDRYNAVLPVLKTGVEMGGFDERRDLARALPPLVVLSLAEDVGQSDTAQKVRERVGQLLTHEQTRGLSAYLSENLEKLTSGLVGRFETALERVPTTETAPLGTGAVKQDLFRGYFFSSLYESAIFYMDAYSSVEATQEFSALLGQSEQPLAGQLQRWMGNLAAAKSGSRVSKDLTRDLMELEALGARPLKRTFDAVAASQNPASPWTIGSVRLLFKHLDTRSLHRSMAADLAQSELYDLRLAMQLKRQLVQADGPKHPYTTTRMAYYERDAGALKSRVRDPRLSTNQRTHALRQLEFMDYADTYIRNEFERLLKQSPRDWSDVYNDYADYLENREDYAAVEELVSRWQTRTDQRSGFDYLDTRRHLSRSLRHRGRLQAAWRVIGPEMDSMQSGVLLEAARVQRDRGNLERATNITDRARERYPDSLAALRLYLELLWRRGRTRGGRKNDSRMVLSADGNAVAPEDRQNLC